MTVLLICNLVSLNKVKYNCILVKLSGRQRRASTNSSITISRRNCLLTFHSNSPVLPLISGDLQCEDKEEGEGRVLWRGVSGLANFHIWLICEFYGRIITHSFVGQKIYQIQQRNISFPPFMNTLDDFFCEFFADFLRN